MMQGCSDENMRCWHFSYLSGYPAEVRKTRGIRRCSKRTDQFQIDDYTAQRDLAPAGDCNPFTILNSRRLEPSRPRDR